MINLRSIIRRADKDGDPLTNIRTITKWLSELPLGDVLASHQKVVEELARLNEKDESLGKDRLDVLKQVDLKAREFQAILAGQYLRNSRMSAAMENTLWKVLHLFHWEIARGYHAFIMDYVTNPAGSKVRTNMPLLIARAMHHFGGIFKWRYIRFERVEEKLWQRLHNLYRIAAFEGFERKRVALYREAERDTSCADEYIRILLLGTISAGGLSPRQMELADAWLRNFSHLVHLETNYDPGKHVFSVVQGSGQGARRVRVQSATENTLFFNTTEMSAALAQAKIGLQDGEPPGRLGLTEDCRVAECLELLDIVMRQWAPLADREQRVAPRHPTQEITQVAYGVAEICARLRAGRAQDEPESDEGVGFDEIIDLKLYGFVTNRTRSRTKSETVKPAEMIAETASTWLVENESDTGCGAIAEAANADALILGKLVAVHKPDATQWQVGIVRRLHRISDKQRFVGVEFFPGTPEVLTLRTSTDAPAISGYFVDSGDRTMVHALMLAGDGEDPDSLIIEATHYSSGREFFLTTAREPRRIVLRDSLLKGDNWVQAHFVRPAPNPDDGAS